MFAPFGASQASIESAVAGNLFDPIFGTLGKSTILTPRSSGIFRGISNIFLYGGSRLRRDLSESARKHEGRKKLPVLLQLARKHIGEHDIDFRNNSVSEITSGQR